jgi:MSHA biogenesis protein MshN
MPDMQLAERDYRRALTSLQEGRIGQATAMLERALLTEPRHEAARQTLIGLQIEGAQMDDALANLEMALTLNPQQPSMAMLLARLQIERGGDGIETLTRSLPAAAGNGEYLAFLGAALQRVQRHAEAIVHYQGALRSAPNNGVWMMGLGISLQAEQRSGEALEAFQKAQAAPMLSPQLQAFVEARIVELKR